MGGVPITEGAAWAKSMASEDKHSLDLFIPPHFGT